MDDNMEEEPVLTGKNISFVELAAERSAEIQKLKDAIDNPNQTLTVCQRLPRHMRRRAVSHDPKRLPARLRELYKRDLTQLKPPKRPSRRHRRRPSQLLLEYNRRQRHHVWLETHLWHARRFHMVKRWGYTLPESAVDKGFRAAYRATAHHCLVQDVSYLCHLELRGPQSALVAGLSKLGAAAAGSSRLLSGRHWGRALLHRTAPPHAALAPAGLLWQPLGGSGVADRRLWLWVHPAGYGEVLEALLEVFQLPSQPLLEPTPAGEPAARTQTAAGPETVTMETDSGGDVTTAGRAAAVPVDAAAAADVSTAAATVAAASGPETVTMETDSGGDVTTVGRAEAVPVVAAAAADVSTAAATVAAAGGPETVTLETDSGGDVTTVGTAKDEAVPVDAAAAADVSTAAATVAAAGGLETVTMETDSGGDVTTVGRAEAVPVDAAAAADVSTAAATVAAASGMSGRNIDQLKLVPRHLEVTTRYSAADVTLTVLRDRLARLRLTGPAAQATLQACLRVSDQPRTWTDALTPQQQRHLWHQLGQATSPGELPDRCVLGLTVDDPRLHMPRTRQMAQQSLEELSDEPIPELPEGAEASPLWDESTRQQVTTRKVSDNQLNLLRSQLLVPTATPECLQLPPVPLLLMQDSRPAGWDLVVPVGWAMTFWVALQYHGARAGGLRETDRLALETGTLRFPAEFPDSKAGQQWDTEQRQKAKLEYFKRPPAKRPNYTKLAVPDPFVSPWWRLCELHPEAVLTVCRDRCLLRRLSACLSSGAALCDPAPPLEMNSSLVAVRVRPEQRGVPEPGALLCLPTAADLTSGTPPAEPTAPDAAEKERTELRTAWLRRQKTEKRRRKRCRRRQQPERAAQHAAEMEAERQKQLQNMQRLFLPGGSVLPSRQEVGRVTSGDFCLSEAVGAGTGFVVLRHLLETVRSGCRGRLLFRNTSATCYRWCRVTVMEEIC